MAKFDQEKKNQRREGGKRGKSSEKGKIQVFILFLVNFFFLLIFFFCCQLDPSLVFHIKVHTNFGHNTYTKVWGSRQRGYFKAQKFYMKYCKEL